MLNNENSKRIKFCSFKVLRIEYDLNLKESILNVDEIKNYKYYGKINSNLRGQYGKEIIRNDFGRS